MNNGRGLTIYNSNVFNNGGTDHSGSGHALHFNGISNYVDCGNNSSLSPASAITAEAWIKLDSINFDGRPWANIINKEGYGSGYYLQFYLGHLSCGINTTTGTHVIDISTSGYEAQTYDLNWHHVAMTYDGSMMKLYYDGNPIGSIPATGQLVASPYNLWIGGMQWVNGRFFQGCIDDVNIWSQALAPGEYLPDSATVALWHMDKGTGNTVEDDTSQNNGNISGATWTNGKYSNGLHFNGTSNYVDCGNNSSLSPGSAITVDAWIKLDSLDFTGRDWANIVSKEGYASGYYLQFVCGYLSCSIRTTTGTYVIDPWTTGYQFQIYDLNWHHVAMTYNGSTMTLYYDNNLVLSIPATGQLVTNTNNLWIGGSQWVNGRFFQGWIDDVSIWNQALVPGEYLPDSATVGLWHMDKGTDNTAEDETSQNNGNISGATWTNGKYSNGLHFNGISNYVDCGNNSSLSSSSAITAEAWIKLDSINFDGRPWANIINKEGPGSGYYLQFYLGHLSCRISTTNGLYVIDINTPGYEPQTYDLNWHHVAMTYDGSMMKLYYDGNPIGSIPATGQLVASPYNLWIGGMQWVNGRFFQGCIDEVRISNTAYASANTTFPVTIMSAPATGSYIRETPDSIIMGNQLLEFVFDKTSGGKLSGIFDKRASSVSLIAGGERLSGEWTLDLDESLSFSTATSNYVSGVYTNSNGVSTLKLYSVTSQSKLIQIYTLNNNSPYIKCQAIYKNLSSAQSYLKTYDYSLSNIALGGSVNNNKFIYPPTTYHLMEGNLSEAIPDIMGQKYVYGNMQQTSKMMLPYTMIYNDTLQECMTIAGVNSNCVVRVGVFGDNYGKLKSSYDTYKHISSGSSESIGIVYVGVHYNNRNAAISEEKGILIAEAGYGAPPTQPAYLKDQVIAWTGIPGADINYFSDIENKLSLAKSRGISSLIVGGKIWYCPWSTIPGTDTLAIYQNGSYIVDSGSGGLAGLQSLISSAHNQDMKIFTWGPTFAGTAQIPIPGGGWTPPSDVAAHSDWWVYNQNGGYNLWYPNYIPVDPGSSWGSQFLIPLVQKMAGTMIGVDGMWLDSSWQDHQLNYQASDGWYGRTNGCKLGLISQAANAAKALNSDFLVMAEGAGAEVYSRVDTAYLQNYGIWPAIEASSVQELIEVEELNRLLGARPFGQICEGVGIYAELADQNNFTLANKYSGSWKAKTFLVNTLDRTPVYIGLDGALLSTTPPPQYQNWVSEVQTLSALRAAHTELKDGTTLFYCVTATPSCIVHYVRSKPNQSSILLLNAETTSQTANIKITNAGSQALQITPSGSYKIKDLMTGTYILNGGSQIWNQAAMTGTGVNITLDSYAGAVLVLEQQ